MDKQSESLIDVLALLYKRRKALIISCLATAIVTAGVSLLLPNYYEASTQFYAASPDLAQPSPIGIQLEDKKIYGNDNDIDRLLSIAKSNTVQNYLIEKFDLFEHYEIDPEEDKAKYKLLLKLNKLFDVSKTKYDAIRLSVEDKDRELAAQMANATRHKIDSLAQKLIKESQKKLIDSYKFNVEEKQKVYDGIADSLFNARVRYGVFNTQSQGEAFGTSMVELEGSIQNYVARIKYLKNAQDVEQDSIVIAESKLAGFRSQYDKLKRSIKSYNDGYPHILRYERELKDFGDQLNLDKERLKQLEAVFGSDVSAIHVVEMAETPVNKSRPKRSYIVIGVTLLCFVLMSLWVIVQDQFKTNNWRSKFNNA